MEFNYKGAWEPAQIGHKCGQVLFGQIEPNNKNLTDYRHQVALEVTKLCKQTFFFNFVYHV